MPRIAPRRHTARASDTPGRRRPAAPPRRLRDCRACARRSGPDGHGTARRVRRRRRRRRPAHGAPPPRRSSPRCLYPRAPLRRHIAVRPRRACDAAVPSRGISHAGHLQVCCHRSWSMSTRATLAGCLVLALSLARCYQDDATRFSPQGLRPRITVRLTDSPFPYDSVASVNLYIVRIEASTQTFGDSTPIGNWVVITEPRKSVNLLAFQRGTTAFLGEGESQGGQYNEVWMRL